MRTTDSQQPFSTGTHAYTLPSYSEASPEPVTADRRESPIARITAARGSQHAFIPHPSRRSLIGRLTSWLTPARPEPQSDVEMALINHQGRALRREAEALRTEREQQPQLQDHHPGWKAAAALLVTGIGAGMAGAGAWSRYRYSHPADVPADNALLPVYDAAPVAAPLSYPPNHRVGTRLKKCTVPLSSAAKPQVTFPCIPYEYTDHQPALCLSAAIRDYCEEKHRNSAILTQQVITLGPFTCLCPPPSTPDIFEIIPPRPACIIEPALSQTTTEKPSDSAKDTAIYLQKRKVPVLPAGSEKSPDHALPATTNKDEVKIEKLYDFSCIAVRQHLSADDILRQIGATLSAPVTSMVQEALIIQRHNIQRQGCPKREDSEQLRQITVKIDALLTSILTMLPGAEPLTVAQTLIGPSLQIAADDIAGKDASPARLGELNQQLLFMFRQTVATLSQPELSGLYNPPPAPRSTTKPATSLSLMLSHRFRLRTGKVQIVLDNTLQTPVPGADNMLYIDTGNRNRPVIYNQKQQHWEYYDQTDSRLRENDNRQSRQRYGLPIHGLPASTHININDRQLLQVTLDGEAPFLAVAMLDMLIPIQMKRLHDRPLVTTVPEQHSETKILRHTDYGWEFERSGCAIDPLLKLLLDTSDSGIPYSTSKDFLPIDDNGISYDSYGLPYLKHNDRYHLLIHTGLPEHYSLADHHDAVLIHQDKMFRLQSSPEMLFPFRTEPAGIREQDTTVFTEIETEAREYLEDHAIPTQQAAVSRAGIGYGLYRDRYHQLLIAAGHQRFEVSSWRDSEIYVKRRGAKNTVDNIRLYYDDGVYLRIRDELGTLPQGYSEISACRVARAPTDIAPCQPVIIENALDEMLTQQIADGKASDKSILNQNLTLIDMLGVPSLYLDVEKMKYYFLYKGHYFEARITEAWEINNPTVMPMMELYTKGNFMSRTHKLPTLVIDGRREAIEIKTLATFLAEKVNVNNGIAEHYIKNRPYRRFTGMQTLEDAAGQVALAGKYYVDPPQLSFEPPLTLLQARLLATRALFPDSVLADSHFKLKVVTLNDPQMLGEPWERAKDQPLPLPEEDYYYLQNLSFRTNLEVKYIRDYMLPVVVRSLDQLDTSFNNEAAFAYLGSALGTDNQPLLLDVAGALQRRLKKISAALAPEKIQLLMATSLVDGIAVPYSDSSLTSGDTGKSRIGWLTPDASSNLYINPDKLLYVDDSIRTVDGLNLVSVLLHQAAHIGGMSADFIPVPRKHYRYIPINDAIEAMLNNIEAINAADFPAFSQLSRRYLENVAVYRNNIDEIATPEKLAWLAKNDVGYRAHLLLNSADMLALMAQDLYELCACASDSNQQSPDVLSSTRTEIETAYRRQENILAHGSISTLYDLHNGYVIKDYTGLITPQYKSRLQAAINNVNGMNRLYGPKAATIMLYPEEHGKASVSVRMRKLPGATLASINGLREIPFASAFRAAMANFITPKKNPAATLAETLSRNGIHHHDINDANLLFDPIKGFQIIDFDSADIRPEGTPLNKQIQEDMRIKLGLQIYRTALAVGLPQEALLKNLDLPHA